ncbi:DNA polymerase III subunit epsilon [Janthinobacterium sp. HH103]|uniref:3'-5' exonuclease n=1 Tax=unclassified Janthinobacterium TaxID=2610881 RepID=UPI0008753A16|nr:MULTISPECIES: exonuclease domain-containing protein [unclassified Janthinobacterium]OEZ66430.1 DNA polymerase III subunit epsilon [Janthinobacterium sp. HH103]OEZ68589.1 DNA polymerase III subunit epsilon [Janthinobacterium sp. HH100]QOU76243.1 DNA polymerase III subunit epsilon [Janthinobacterium sp. HH102]
MEPSVVAPIHTLDPLIGPVSVIDTETTGLNPRLDRIISFGHVRVHDGKIVDSVEWFFNPGNVEIHPDALKVHGITKEFLADKPPIKGYLAKILELLIEAIVCGHNVKFDIDMLNAELVRHRFPRLDQYIIGVFDTMAESRKRWPGKPAHLDALCERVGISIAHRTRHGALTDAMLCAESLLAMHREQRNFDALLVDELPDLGLCDAPIGFAPILVVAASNDELLSHEAYLSEMGTTPIWCANPETGQEEPADAANEMQYGEDTTVPR